MNIFSKIWLNWAQAFDNVQRFFNGNFWQDFVNRFGEFDNKRVIDLACGTGELRKFIKPKNYLGIDLNPAYINFAKKRFTDKNSKFILSDIISKQIPQGYETAFLISASHHLSDQQLSDLFVALAKSHIKKIIIVDGTPIGPFAKLLKSLDAILGGGRYFRSINQLSNFTKQYFKVQKSGSYDIKYSFYKYQYLIALKDKRLVNLIPKTNLEEITSPQNQQINIKKFFNLAITLTCLLFLVFFINKSFTIMHDVPFYDFDEAHRAENAKRMKEYQSYLVPLTGSPFDRVGEFRIPFKQNPDLFLYYHLERPTFVYWLMMVSTSVFGSIEFAYRLPSFILGFSTLITFLMFAKAIVSRINYVALFVGFLSLLTAGDLWLSSQQAQLDTGLTTFLFSSVLSLIFYCSSRKKLLLILAGLSFSLAVLSKGQPAFIIIFPMLYLLISKKLSFKEFLQFSFSASVILIPWVMALSIKFGLINMIKIFSGFAISSAIVEYLYHQAPIFWYVRWWWESFRPGLSLFLVLLMIDLIYGKLTWQKKILLSYIFGGLLVYSLAINKIWWYILPLVPAVSFYIYLAASDYLINSKRLLKISLVILLASLPFLLGVSNRLAMAYGILVTLASLLILSNKFSFPSYLVKRSIAIFFLIIVFSLGLFYYRFPKTIPYHKNTKAVGGYFANLPGKKCLYVYDMPPEAALFYSNSGEIIPLTRSTNLFPNCNNYLITPSLDYKENILFQRGTMKLIKL